VASPPRGREHKREQGERSAQQLGAAPRRLLGRARRGFGLPRHARAFAARGRARRDRAIATRSSTHSPVVGALLTTWGGGPSHAREIALW